MTWARARRGHHLIGAAEDVLHAAAERTSPVADDGERQYWATIRSGLSKGLLQPIDWTPTTGLVFGGGAGGRGRWTRRRSGL